MIPDRVERYQSQEKKVSKEVVKKAHILKREKEISKLESLINRKDNVDMSDIRKMQ